jgi:prepilin-type N-terminal cleavage/methylation domain-containing protein
MMRYLRLHSGLRPRNRAGVTLLELMIVTLIIGILALIAVNPLMKARYRAMDSAARSHLRNTVTVAAAYQAIHGVLPTRLADLETVGFVRSGKVRICYFNLDGAAANPATRLTIEAQHANSTTVITTVFPGTLTYDETPGDGLCEEVTD